MTGILPRGEIITTRFADGTFTIDHADPRVLISGELLASMYVDPASGVTIGQPEDGPNGTPFWRGATLTIRGINRTVIYRITEYVPQIRAYIGEWPDLP